MITDYFAYERSLWHESVLPVLRPLGLSFDGKRVLDVGCGHGGMLEALVDSFAVREAVGIDLDPEMIANARRRARGGTRFLERDLFAFEADEAFDAVFLRDVLEHIVEPERALERAVELTRSGGVLFASYAPFYGPFGGHQHNGSGVFSNLPWLQLLPEPLFRRLIRVRGNAYKREASLAADVESVLQTRLSMRRLDRLLQRTGLRVLARRTYLVRPDYRLKFGLPTVELPRWSPLIEALCTAEVLVLGR